MSANSKKQASVKPRSDYHHGNLRAALIAAGEEELTAKGIEGFSLRGVAKRAGVSHAAPAHHFGDVQGLLTELAKLGFRKLVKSQQARLKQTPAEEKKLVASGLGYIDFALDNPALFRLIFSSDRPDFTDPDLTTAAQAAYTHLTDEVLHLQAPDDLSDTDRVDILTSWGLTHGLADLLCSGQPGFLSGIGKDKRDELLSHTLKRIKLQAD